MNRRGIFALTVLPVAACGVVPATPSTPSTVDKTVQAVFAQSQYALILLKALASGIAIAVPAASGIVAVIDPYLNAASKAFQGLQADMPVGQARPIAQNILIGLKAAVNAIADVVNAAAPGSTLAKFKPEVQEVQTVISLISAFITPVQAEVTRQIMAKGLPLLHR